MLFLLFSLWECDVALLVCVGEIARCGLQSRGHDLGLVIPNCPQSGVIRWLSGHIESGYHLHGCASKNFPQRLLLFLVLIGDTGACLTWCEHVIYADDLQIWPSHEDRCLGIAGPGECAPMCVLDSTMHYASYWTARSPGLDTVLESLSAFAGTTTVALLQAVFQIFASKVPNWAANLSNIWIRCSGLPYGVWRWEVEASADFHL